MYMDNGLHKKSQVNLMRIKKPAKSKGQTPPAVLKAMMVLEKNGYLGYLTLINDKTWLTDQYRRMCYAVLVLSILLCVSFTGNIFQVVIKPDPKNFGLTRDLRVIEMVPLGESYINNSALNNWVAETVTRTLSLSFSHYNQQLGDLKASYYDGAYEEVLTTMEASGFLPAIRGDDNTAPANSNATLTSPAIVTFHDLYLGVMTWKIEFPLIINFEFKNGGRNNQKRLATVIVQRVPLKEHPRGVKIKQLNLEQI